jgi:predicted RNase H-like HicB family nuclease
MSKRSGTSSKRTKLERPFDPAVLARARKIVGRYRLVLEHNEDLGYIGSAIEMPAVFADGRTPDDCVRATREALAVAAATMIEQGRRPPSAVGRGVRETQVNIRLSADEKYRLQEAARHLGFKGVSDFIRAVALERSSVA